MIHRIALLATAGVFAASVAGAQNPPPGNVNPGSMQSGAEQTGASNQPRSPVGQMGTTGTGTGATTQPAQSDAGTEGVKGNVNPGSMESTVPSGQPASKPR